MADLALDIWLTAHDSFSGIFEKMGVEAEGLRGKLGLLAGGVGLLAGGLLAESVKQASDFSTMVNQVAGNTTMTTAGIAQMSAAIKELSAHSSASMDDLAHAWMHVTNLGFTKAADAQKVVNAAMESAISTGGSVVSTANVLANAMHEYSIGAQDAGHAMDVLHLASAEGNTTLEDFVDGAGRAIGMAANLGVGYTQVSAAISALTRHGYDASTASTQMIGLMEHITNPAQEAQKALNYLSATTGIDLVRDFSQAGLKAKGLSGVLDDVARATHGNAAMIEKLIPALRGGLGAMALTGTGAADFHAILRDLNETMAGKSAPTAEAYARTQATLGFQMGELKNNVQQMAISLGNALLPEIVKLAHAAVPLVQHLADWIKHHQKLTLEIVGAVAVVGTLVGALVLLAPAIAALASPVGMVVMALAGAVAGLVLFATHTKEVRAILQGVWSAIADDAQALWGWLTGIWTGISGDAMQLWEDLGDWLGGIWRGITGAASDIWNGLVRFFGTDLWADLGKGWRATWDGVGTLLHNAWTAITTDATATWGGIGTFFSGVWGQIRTLWTGFWDGVGTLLHGAWTTITEDARSVWASVSGFFGGVWGTIRAGWSGFWDGVGTLLHDAWTTITQDARTVWSTVAAFFSGVWGTLRSGWDGFWDGVGALLHNAWTTITHDATVVWGTVASFFGGVWGPIRTTWDTFWAGVGTALHRAWTAISTTATADWHGMTAFVKGAWGGISASFTQVWASIKTVLHTAWHAISTTATHDWGAIKTATTSAWSTLSTDFTHIWTEAKTALHGAWTALQSSAKDWGGKIAKGFGDGFSGALGALTALGGAAGSAGSGLFDALGTMAANVSTWMHQNLIQPALDWGKNILKNIAQGIADAGKTVYKALHDVFEKLAKLLTQHSPALEGPLAVLPEFTYIAAAIRAAEPQVRAAGRDLTAAARQSLPGMMAAHLSVGGSAPAGGGGNPLLAPSGLHAGSAAGAGSGAQTITIAPSITIQGGTFTDRQGIKDLAHQVSEEIMRSVRMQGGLLPQM